MDVEEDRPKTATVCAGERHQQIQPVDVLEQLTMNTPSEGEKRSSCCWSKAPSV